MKYILLFFTLITTTSVFAQLQPVDEEVVLDIIEQQSQLDLLENVDGNALRLDQVGNFNNATINQAGINKAQINQQGDYHEATLTQTGSDITTFVNQYGSDNTYNGDISGSNIDIVTNQDGTNNSIDQTIAGDNVTFQLNQYGNNNQLIQVENDGLTDGYSVTQTGNNMTIIIENRNIYTP